MKVGRTVVVGTPLFSLYLIPRYRQEYEPLTTGTQKIRAATVMHPRTTLDFAVQHEVDSQCALPEGVYDLAWPHSHYRAFWLSENVKASITFALAFTVSRNSIILVEALSVARVRWVRAYEAPVEGDQLKVGGLKKGRRKCDNINQDTHATKAGYLNAVGPVLKAWACRRYFSPRLPKAIRQKGK